MSLLGIDVGTTGCKAAAFSLDGRELAGAYREHPAPRAAPGRAELDAPAIWENVKAVIAEVAARTSADPVTALSVSSMGEAVVPVSRDRRILGNSILSSDPRGAEYARELAAAIGQEDFYRINPNLIGPQYTLPKLRWLREHEPELYRRADKFLYWADLVAFLLGGEARANFTHANRSLLFDLRAGKWSERLVALGGLDAEKLGHPAPSGTVVGEVAPAIAAEIGLPAGAKIVLGGHDQCCNSLGAGAAAAGRTVCGIGTYECYTPAYARIPEPAAMIGLGLNVEHHVLPGLYVSFLYNPSGALVRWFRDTFAAGMAPGPDIYDRLSAEMPEEPTSLLTLPSFDVTGPPDYLADARGLIAGLRTSTTRGEILKSIMESATFHFVAGIEGLRALGMGTSEMVATGGGAKSDRWLQIKADIFGVPFVRPRTTECSALGAAMLAGLATGRLRDAGEAAARFVAAERRFEPDPARHGRYRERLELFRQLLPLAGGFLRRL
ncbi:MAG TPA: FGGY-family carbohydrate kinase [Planctomycetota bacterium]|nr:FGGY-family carbohydrate kinase [Planctomycetota bacterium]